MNNQVILIIVLIIVIGGIVYCYNMNKTKEGFLGNLPSMQINKQTIGEQTTGLAKGSFFSVPGNFQANVSPRFSNVDYGAQITYNLPSIKHQGVPKSPLALGSMATECYNKGVVSKENFPTTCGMGGTETIVRDNTTFTTPGYAAGDYNEVLGSAYSNGLKVSDAPIPVGDMTTIDALGNPTQNIVYDRLMVANRNSYLRGQGDMIRGDLAIAPVETGWFRTSVNPIVDLQQGAMNVMGGVYNETSNNLAQLLYKSSGNSSTTIAGVDMANQLTQTNTRGYSDIAVTAFP